VAVDVVMPRLSDQMVEGTVVRWLKQPGEAVTVGEELVEIETDKATWIVEAEDAGTLAPGRVPEGAVVAVGQAIARLAAPGEDAGALVPVGAEAVVAAPATELVAEALATPAGRTTRHRATPVARRRALELGIDLGSVAGTGPGGRIVVRDVVTAAPDGVAQLEAAGGGDRRGTPVRVPLTVTRRTIARRLAESKSTIPHFTVTVDVDMSAALDLRAELRAAAGDDAPTVNDLVVRASALALREHPGINASLVDDVLLQWPAINVGIAVDTPEALLVPVLHGADQLPLATLAARSRELVRRARDRSLSPADLADGTFTVSNLGMLGVGRFTAIVNPPQVAILAVGAAAPRPVVSRDGAAVVRPVLTATLSADHRVVYGADAARFLARLRVLLEQPAALTV
jgi:pyruvate dehydrogenase E2 component (dihydrolipoamide acetyltransferase)